MDKIDTNKYSKFNYKHPYSPSVYIYGPNKEILSTDGKTLFSVPNTIVDYKIPDGVENIYDGVFANCHNLKRIVFPSSIKILGDDVFKNCSNLIILNLPDSIHYFGPHFLRGSSVCYIRILPTEPNKPCNFYFHNNGLYSNKNELLAIMPTARVFIIEPFVISIREGVFQGMEYINEIYFPKNCEKIQSFFHEGMFKSCKNLSKIHNIQSLKTIPKETFAYCNLWELPQFETIENIEERAFYNAGLYFIDLPNSLQNIGEHAFAYCKFKHITIPSSVKNIGRWAFSYCLQLTEATLIGSDTKIGTVIFNECCNLRNIILPQAFIMPKYSLGYGLKHDCNIIRN